MKLIHLIRRDGADTGALASDKTGRAPLPSHEMFAAAPGSGTTVGPAPHSASCLCSPAVVQVLVLVQSSQCPRSIKSDLPSCSTRSGCAQAAQAALARMPRSHSPGCEPTAPSASLPPHSAVSCIVRRASAVCAHASHARARVQAQGDGRRTSSGMRDLAMRRLSRS